jgi:hypothetical protein
MLKPGTLITDLEGYDLGEQGAVVVSVDGDEVELAKLDTEEIITVNLSNLAYTSEEAPEAPGLYPHLIDEEALDSPELHTIRWLPEWWGPRDVNSPSSLTDTIWRPEPIWHRQLHRYYSVEDHMSRKTRSRSRVSASEAPASPPDPTGKTRLERDYGLPRRLRLDLWVEGPNDTLDTDALRDLACEFWAGYRDKRLTYMSEHGDRKSMNLEDWALAFQRRAGLTIAEMGLLYRFMTATKLVPPNEAQQYQDLIDTYQSYRYDWL